VLLFSDMARSSSAVHAVDLATGVCFPQPSNFNPRHPSAAVRLPDGRIVCKDENLQITMVLGSPNGASGQWMDLPGHSVARTGCGACVMSDGCFAVFGGWNTVHGKLSSCETLSMVGTDARWDPLPSMHQARYGKSACAAIAGCVIVAGGDVSATVEVYEEGLGRWRRLPCNLPDSASTSWMGSAVS
jgi:hypothetical protein